MDQTEPEIIKSGVVALAGPPNAGKSTLINDTLYKAVADELNRTSRNPAPHDEIRGLEIIDRVIDINYYSVPAAEQSNFRHRPVGLGLMGFQESLYKQHIAYGSEQAVEFADRSMEAISYFAIQASSELAVERGAYSSYEGSLWGQGVFPIDSLERLIEQRGADYIQVDRSQTLDWPTLREQVKSRGMRNSNVMAIAPTATIANITGVSQCADLFGKYRAEALVDSDSGQGRGVRVEGDGRQPGAFTLETVQHLCGKILCVGG